MYMPVIPFINVKRSIQDDTCIEKYINYKYIYDILTHRKRAHIHIYIHIYLERAKRIYK